MFSTLSAHISTRMNCISVADRTDATNPPSAAHPLRASFHVTGLGKIRIQDEFL